MHHHKSVNFQLSHCRNSITDLKLQQTKEKKQIYFSHITLVSLLYFQCLRLCISLFVSNSQPAEQPCSAQIPLEQTSNLPLWLSGQSLDTSHPEFRGQFGDSVWGQRGGRLRAICEGGRPSPRPPQTPQPRRGKTGRWVVSTGILPDRMGIASPRRSGSPSPGPRARAQTRAA